MASADFLKITRASIAGTVVHFDECMRQYKKHSNKDINPELSHLNYNLINFETESGTATWQEIMQKCYQRVDDIDAQYPPERVRTDRKIADYLYTPCPKVITDMGMEDDFFKEAFELQKRYFGDNVIGMQVHKDERHEYVDHGKIKTSLSHGHSLIVAETDWEQVKKDGTTIHRHGINSKNFNTAEMFKNFNEDMDKMCRERFGVAFKTGESVRKKSVEALKLDSYYEAKEILKHEQRKVVKLTNENQLLISENSVLSAQLEEKQAELKKANSTLEILDTTCASLHEEIVGLKRDIAHIIEENKVPDDVVQGISNGIQDAVMDAFDNGRRAGQEGYERERLTAFKSDSVCKALRPLDRPLEKFKAYTDNLRSKIHDAIDMHNRNANRARQLALGNIDVYTGYDGRVSESGKMHIERYIRARLESYDQDETWEPLRMQYRGLVTDEKKDRYVNRMVKDCVDFAEDSCAEKPTTKYVPKSKIEKLIDRCASSMGHGIGHGALEVVRTIQQIQEEQLEEYER